jgi:hypothetical protein
MIKAFIISLSLLVFLAVSASALQVDPAKDILTKNADGEIVKIFGPSSFYFDGAGFESPVKYVDGTAKVLSCKSCQARPENDTKLTIMRAHRPSVPRTCQGPCQRICMLGGRFCYMQCPRC